MPLQIKRPWKKRDSKTTIETLSVVFTLWHVAGSKTTLKNLPFRSASGLWIFKKYILKIFLVSSLFQQGAKAFPAAGFPPRESWRDNRRVASGSGDTKQKRLSWMFHALSRRLTSSLNHLVVQVDLDVTRRCSSGWVQSRALFKAESLMCAQNVCCCNVS